jgi:hypothetical protein
MKNVKKVDIKISNIFSKMITYNFLPYISILHYINLQLPVYLIETSLMLQNRRRPK